MSTSDTHMEAARNLVDEWLSEQEGYAIRAERMPEGSRDWLIAACSIGLAAGERRGMERAAEICGEVKRDFLSPEYATPQPIGSVSERFACEQCSRAILSNIDEASQ